MVRAVVSALCWAGLAFTVFGRRLAQSEDKSIGPGTAPHNGVSGAQEWWLGASDGTPPSGPMYGGQPLGEALGLYNWTSPMYRVTCKDAMPWKQKDRCMATVVGHACGHDISNICSSLAFGDDCSQPPGKLSSSCLYCLALAKDPTIRQKATELRDRPTEEACANLAEKGYRKVYSRVRSDGNLSEFVAATPGLTLEAATEACGNEDDLTCQGTAPEDCGFCDDVHGEGQDCHLAMGLLKHLQTYNWFSSTWFGQRYCDGVRDDLDKGTALSADMHPGTLRCYGLRRLIMHEIERSQNVLINTKDPTTRLLHWVCGK